MSVLLWSYSISIGLVFLEAVLGVDKCFLQWISNAEVRKRFGSLALIEATKHKFCSQTSLYRVIGLVCHLFFKCNEMRLSWVFTVKTAVILLKYIFEFMFNKARLTFTGRAGGSMCLGERL